MPETTGIQDAAADNIPPVQPMTAGTIPPVQPMTADTIPPVQPMTAGNIPPVQPMTAGNIPPVQPMTADTIPPAQPMTYQSVQNSGMPDMPSRYQEIGMGDVIAQKKSHKKLIIAIVSILLVISLAVGGYFIYRLIRKNTLFSKIKEQPTAYVVSAYGSTAKAMNQKSEITRVFNNSADHGSVTAVIDYGENGRQTSVTSFDRKNKRYYQSMKTESNGKEGNCELYADINKVVLVSSNDKNSFDYCLNLKDLRTNAATSVFGPDNQDGLGVTQEQYDTLMDVYEFVYNGISKDGDDYFGLKDFGEKLSKDLDECGNVEVTEENVDIFGEDTKAFVVRHTFKDTSILNAVYVDFKNWAEKNIKINDKLDAQIMEAIGKIDPIQLTSRLEGNDYEVSFRHYINKDNGTIMKAEFCVTYQKQSVTLSLIFGADPASSSKTSIEIAAVGMKQTITATDASTDSQEKVDIKLEGVLLNGTVTYTRDKSTGDFTIVPDVKAMTMGGMRSGSSAQSSAEPKTLSGNIKATGDSVTIRLTNKEENGSPIKAVEYTISTNENFVELNSDNDILKASKEELIKNFQSISLTTPISTITTITPSSSL